MADLRARAIPRLHEPNALTRERPNIPLSELTEGGLPDYKVKDDEQAQGTLGPADNAD